MDKEKVISKFVNDLKEVLTRENEDREDYSKKKLNLPFMICPIQQNLNNEKYQDLLNQLNCHDYFMNYFGDATDGYTGGKVEIIFHRNDTEKSDDYYCPEVEAFTYVITFTYDQRHWGYCECTDKDEDYREDKDCCGHGCDWTAPAFTVEKVYDIGVDSFDGDAHDYWDFEDNFYLNDEELRLKREQEEKDFNIKHLRDEIAKYQKQLDKLMME